MTSTPTVTKSPPALIPPAGPTPCGTLPFSSIDKTVAGSGFVNLMQVFPPPSISAARKDQGAVAAVAAMRNGCPLLIPGELLLPRPPPGEKLSDLILIAQATRFTCGGFAVGIRFSHAVFDGHGAAQFLTAVGELARGLKAPSVAPVWDRDAIPEAPSPLPGQLTEFRLVTQVDYGFGAPGYVFPLNDHVNFVAALNYVRPPAPRRGGIRVVLRCVEEPHAAAFAVELAKFA
uniref:3'-N-debenzoyl-2'-deoxytaxol N-benzoyltransferase n=1 Tax=Aegilops tauschii TaxID=37682 RepID=R7WCY8_AEGTA